MMQTGGARTRWRAWTASVAVALTLGLNACDPGRAPTQVTPSGTSIDGEFEGDGPPAAPTAEPTGPEVPPWAEELEIEALLRADLVDFPPPHDVGVCHTQVNARQRPIPFRIHRLPLELPDEAWDDAAGRVAMLEYRRKGPNGFVVRLARCRIPASQLAVDALSTRFHLPPDRPGDTPATRLNLIESLRWGAWLPGLGASPR